MSKKKTCKESFVTQTSVAALSNI